MIDSQPPEMPMHSFVVRLWQEQTDPKGKESVWFGYIYHVASGKRVYFHDLERVIEVIESYLKTVSDEG